MLTIILILLLVVLLILAAYFRQNGTSNKKNAYPYEKAKILTNHELNFYMQLVPIANELNLQVFPKVRFADIVKITSGLSSKERNIAFNKIKAKHADFVLVNRRTIETVCVIELDDKTHNKKSAEKNDNFKNETLKKAKINLIRINTKDGLKEKIIQAIIPPSPMYEKCR